MEELYEEHFREEVEKIIGNYEQELFPSDQPISLSEILDLETFLEHLLSTTSLEEALKMKKQLEISKSPNSTTSTCSKSPTDIHALPITSPEILLHTNTQNNKSIYFAETNFTLVEDSFSSASTMGPSPLHSFQQTAKIIDESIAHYTPNNRHMIVAPKIIVDSTEKEQIVVEERVHLQAIIASQGTPIKEEIKVSPSYFSPIIGRKSDASLLYSPMTLDQDTSDDETKITLEEYIKQDYHDLDDFPNEVGGFEPSFTYEQSEELEKQQKELLQRSFERIELEDSPVYERKHHSPPTYIQVSPPLLYSSTSTPTVKSNTMNITNGLFSTHSTINLKSPLHSRNSFHAYQPKQNRLLSNPVEFFETKRNHLQFSTNAQVTNSFSKNVSSKNANGTTLASLSKQNFHNSSINYTNRASSNSSSTSAEDSFVDLEFDDLEEGEQIQNPKRRSKKAQQNHTKKIPLQSVKK